jgi:hypothetical protein
MRFPHTGAEAVAATAAFYRNPPFADGHFGPRMGLEPLPLARWLPFAISASEQLRKQRLFRSRSEQVYGALARPAPVGRAVALVHEVVCEAQPEPPPLPLAADLPALVATAERIPDDLLLLWRPAPGAPYRLLAASLCSPSFWRLEDKLGGTLAAVHAPVQGVSSRLLERMTHFFEHLPHERGFVRRNWSVHPKALRFEPDPARGSEDPGPGADWFIRSERQTVRRLAEDLVLFTVRVDLHALAVIHRYPAALADLTLALTGLAADDLAEFGGRSKRRRVLEALAGRAG